MTWKVRSPIYSSTRAPTVDTLILHLVAAWPSTIDDFVEWARERLKVQDAGFT